MHRGSPVELTTNPETRVSYPIGCRLPATPALDERLFQRPQAHEQRRPILIAAHSCTATSQKNIMDITCVNTTATSATMKPACAEAYAPFAKVPNTNAYRLPLLLPDLTEPHTPALIACGVPGPASAGAAAL